MLLVSRSSLARVSCVSVLAWWMSLPLAAGEKANITPPTKKNPDSLTNPQNEPAFQPLDAANSLGGFLDQGGSSALPTVEAPVPDARTQMEILEQIDRRRNFLLNGIGDNSNPADGVDWIEINRLRSSRSKPQTALERHWYQSVETSAAGPSTLESAADEDDPLGNPAGPLARPSLGFGADDQGISGTLTTIDRNLARPDSFFSPLGDAGKPAATTVLEDLRSPWATTSGRDLGLDALSRQRLDRYQQLSGEGESLRRGLGSESVDSDRSRDLRLDTLDPLFSPSASSVQTLSPPAPVLDATATVDRMQMLTTFGSGVQQNPYNSVPATPPPISPAAKFLKEPRPEPPRFRP